MTDNITCSYCEGSFVLDNPAKDTAEIEKKFGVRTAAITAVFLVVIVIAVVVLIVSMSKPADSKAESGIDAEFSHISTPASVSVSEAVVEKDYYTFRMDSARQLMYEKQDGAAMGFPSPKEFEAGANEVIFSPDTLTRTASDGCRIFYQEKTNLFVKLYNDGAIRLFCSPANGMDFFESN